jgi:hypothetical protein
LSLSSITTHHHDDDHILACNIALSRTPFPSHPHP